MSPCCEGPLQRVSDSGDSGDNSYIGANKVVIIGVIKAVVVVIVIVVIVVVVVLIVVQVVE